MSHDLDLPPLSGALRAMLDAERESHAVSSDRRSRLRIGVARKLATAAATATTLLIAEEAKGQIDAAAAALRGHDELTKQALEHGATAVRHAASSGATTAIASATKAALVSKVGVVVTGLAFAGGVSVGTQVPRAPVAVVETTPVAVEPRTPTIAVQPTPLAVVADATVDEGVATTALRVTREIARVETPTHDGTLMLEQALIERAQRAIASSDYTSALTALDEHRTRFPRGELVEERLAFLAIAYLRSGQREAGERAAHAYLERYPNAALARVITRELEQ